MQFKEPHLLILSQKLYVVPMTTRTAERIRRPILFLNYLLLLKSALTLNLTHAHTTTQYIQLHTHIQKHTHTHIRASNNFSFSLPVALVLMEKSTIMCDSNVRNSEVNYRLIFILFTSDSWVLWVMSDWTYAEEPILVTSCRVFALKLHQKSVKATLSGL